MELIFFFEFSNFALEKEDFPVKCSILIVKRAIVKGRLEAMITYNQDSLFDKQSQNSQKLDVVRMDFIEAQALTWKELFQGYDKLYAITYSSAIGFVSELLKLFDYAEIIFGYEGVINYDLHEVMAYQQRTIENLKESGSNNKIDLAKRIYEGTLKLHVADKKLSHEKLYLLEANDGSKRVITGSANMSYSAFKGLQRENIIYIDGDKAFAWYFQQYQELQSGSTSEITKKALGIEDLTEEVDELPLFNKVKVQKAMIIEKETVNSDAIKFVFSVDDLSKQYKKSIPPSDRKGKVFLSPEKVIETRRRLIENKRIDQEMRSEYPALVLDYDNRKAILNDIPLDLEPDTEEIRRDAELFLEYMNGYEKFYGNVAEMQSKYYAFAVWFLTSPFMAIMRITAERNNRPQLPYPVFGLIYGKSKAGKTSFLETLLKMMIGQKTKLVAPDFTRTNIDGLKRMVKGAPIIVDDLNQSRFSTHAIEMIKNDDFGVLENNESFPAVVISANEDVKAVAPEIIRRTVICHVQAGLTNREVMRDRIVRKVQSNIGTALYREFLRRMFEKIPSLIDELMDQAIEYNPDILAEASSIFYEILSEYTDVELPIFIRRLSLDDYFGEKITSSQAIDTIRRAWMINKKAFSFDKKQNTLTYNAGQNWDASYIVKELPEDLEAKQSRELVVFDIDKASRFFEIDFRKEFGWIGRFIK
jgi:hypothetical protein